MEIRRVNIYNDSRFSQTALNQHGCFLVDEDPYEIEILSDREAVIRGANTAFFSQIIEEFRFYTPHITRFYDINRAIVREYPEMPILKLDLKDIQPSQFYVDEEKIAAIGTFLKRNEDIIVQVLKSGERYISLDGHTRLYYAVMMGWSCVRAIEADSDDYIFGFVEEAIARNIRTPYDLKLVSHRAYLEKWDKFCDDYFAKQGK